MRFCWSTDDIIAGINLLWNVWNSVSDGPRSARLEATQFYEDFRIVKNCLEDWDSRNKACSGNLSLTGSLRDKCIAFIEGHMRLIHQVNPDTRAVRNGCSIWLKCVSFTKEQVLTLYQQVQWPLVRGQIADLRTTLGLSLGAAAYGLGVLNHNVNEDTNKRVRQLSISLYVSSCLSHIRN